MKNFIHIFLFFAVIVFCCHYAHAQETATQPESQHGSLEELYNPYDDVAAEGETDYNFYEIQSRINSYFEELEDLQEKLNRPFQITRDQRHSANYIKRLNDDLRLNERKLKSVDLRWNIYYQTAQPSIANDDQLMAMVEDLNTIKQEIEDSVESKKAVIQAVKDFSAAEKFLSDQDTVYKLMGRKALELSMTSKTAPQLENLKVKEQIIFADIQSNYDKARQGAELFKVSQQDMDNLHNRYASLKNMSGKIQEMAYKPFIQRIKDYLLGVAAVAIIIMFLNMMVSKIKAAKKMKENLKKYQESINQNNNDIPTI